MSRRARIATPELYLLEGRALRSAFAAHLPDAPGTAPILKTQGLADPAQSEAKTAEEVHPPGHTGPLHGDETAPGTAGTEAGKGAGQVVTAAIPSDAGAHGGGGHDASAGAGTTLTAGLVAAPDANAHGQMPGMSSGAVASAMSDVTMLAEVMGRMMPAEAGMPSMTMLRPTPGGPFGQDMGSLEANTPRGMGAESTSSMPADDEALTTGLNLGPDIEPRIDVETSPQGMAKSTPSGVLIVAARGKASGLRVTLDDSDEPVGAPPRRLLTPVEAPPAGPPHEAWSVDYDEPELAGASDAMTVLVGITAALAWKRYEKASRRRTWAADHSRYLGEDEGPRAINGLRIDSPVKFPPLPYYSEFAAPTIVAPGRVSPVGPMFGAIQRTSGADATRVVDTPEDAVICKLQAPSA